MCQPPDKQLQRTVKRYRGRDARASFHYALAARFTRQRAAAQLRRHAALRPVAPALSLAVLLMMVLSSPARAEDLVAVVDLKFLEDTGRTASVLCLGENPGDCVAWSTLYLYEARVRKVLSGTESRTKLRVIQGAHALAQSNIRRLVAVLRKLESSDPSGADYQVVRWGEERLR